MAPQSLPSPSISTPESLDAQVLKGFCSQLKSLASTAGFNAIETVHNENTKLHSQLKSKNHELEGLRVEMNEKEKKKEMVINEMFEANEREKGRHNETKDQVLSLQKVIQDKEKTISERENRINELEKLAKKFQSEKAYERGKLADAEKKLNTLQQTVQDKESNIDKMKSVEADLREKLSASKKRVEQFEDETCSLKESLAKTQARLIKLEGFAAGHSEANEDTLFGNYWGLWEFAKTEIYTQLNTDLPVDTLRVSSSRNAAPTEQDRRFDIKQPSKQQNPSAWDKLRYCDIVRTHQVPLPCSNTVAAKQMRLAVILAILAREIATHIFQPIYIAPMDDKFLKALTDLAATDSEKELFCRSILLSMNPEIQSQRCFANIQTVVTNVSAYLDDLLSTNQRHVFHRSLELVVQKAVDTWKPIQCSQRRYETDFEPAIDDDDWKLFKFPKHDNATAENSANQKNRSKSALAVFPCLSVIENQASTAYTHAIRLSSSQHQWIAAQREMVKEPPSPTLGRAFTWRRKSNKSKDLSSTPNEGSKKRNGS